MAKMTNHLPADVPNDLMWLPGMTTVAEPETYSFASPYNDYAVVVSGSGFAYDGNGNPTGGTYDKIAVYTDAAMTTLLAEINGLASPLANYNANHVDDLAAAGVVADTPVGAFGNDTFVFAAGYGNEMMMDGSAQARGQHETLDFAAFNYADAGNDVSFNILADVLSHRSEAVVHFDADVVTPVGFDIAGGEASVIGGIFE